VGISIMSLIHAWENDPMTAFNAFIASPDFAQTSRRQRRGGVATPLSHASLDVYCFMFRKFVSWLTERRLTLTTLTEADLFAFIDQRGPDGALRLNSSIARRYLRLLERCYRHLNLVPNPAQSAMLAAASGAHALRHDADTAALAPAQVTRFLAALPPADGSWKQQRDRAMQLVMLFGGLTVAEVIGFMVSEVGAQSSLDGALELALTPAGKHQSSHAHTTRLHADAVPELLAWLAVRRSMPLHGALVFPANFRGDALNKSTVYRQAKATFDQAGLALPRLGGRTLRNSFAVRELATVPIDELTERLGLALTRSTERYVAAKRRQG
jgi:integrase/recombinase XerD